MANRRSRRQKQHSFYDKLLLNQWLISLFGIDPLTDHTLHGKKVRPFSILVDPIKDPRMEGLDADNLHRFYHNLVGSELFWNDKAQISKLQLLSYEENIVSHTFRINEKRQRPVQWKYFQWLSLLFSEIFLDKYFNQRDSLLFDLNSFVADFNNRWSSYKDVPDYTEDDLNKLCIQNATGSGKTLLMHVNLLQFGYYAKKVGKDKQLSRVILLTPNERLSEQHFEEFNQSGIDACLFSQGRNGLFTQATGLERVDILEITKLADQEGPNTIATRTLGDQNLLIVDEGHRGMSSTEEGAWFSRRASLCEKGFTFEYSATFQQAVSAAKNEKFEESYSKAVLFDYSYRWFYEDGFGKDYQIFNLPDSFQQVRDNYLTACLLKYYQQILIYEEEKNQINPFNLEKPLWVFVGSTVTKAKKSKDEEYVVADVAQILQFLADFLAKSNEFKNVITTIMEGTGQDTGLIDKNDIDIFERSFPYLARKMSAGMTVENIYKDILGRIFNNPGGGHLEIVRVKGDSGEILLRLGNAREIFGLINVGDASGLCEHVQEVCTNIQVLESDFNEATFSSVKLSSSPVNILLGSKKFVEGWDCWRVSTLGLMHVGKSEGSQIIQLFGRGVRLKGYKWSLKRSAHSFAPEHPPFIEELETLNVFGIEADFMDKFRDFLKEEGLPGNERRKIFTIPLNMTYDFGKKLQILRPKKKKRDGREYSFKKDGPVPSIGDIPEYLQHHKVDVDWYPRIQSISSGSNICRVGQKANFILSEEHLSMLDYDSIFFVLERFKRERSWHNLNISKEGIKKVLSNPNWYNLYIPKAPLEMNSFHDVATLQQVASVLLKRYCDHLYNYCKRSFMEPRLELRELSQDDAIWPPNEGNKENDPWGSYQIIVDGQEERLINQIQQISNEIRQNKDYLRKLSDPGDLKACNWKGHLFQPLFHARPRSEILVVPVSLNESEYQFVEDLQIWSKKNKDTLEENNCELFLLRNKSRGKGVGFFEAANFHPDFILWILKDNKQYVNFIEPHGLQHEGPASEKILFYQRIKDVEKRLNNEEVILNSFILSWSRYSNLTWGLSKNKLHEEHVLFMTDDRYTYIDKLFEIIVPI